jgi:hypothetical protein
LAKTKIIERSELDPWKLFLNAMRSPVTRDRYSTRVAKFFDYAKIRGITLEQKAATFARKGKKDTNWSNWQKNDIRIWKQHKIILRKM